MKSIFFVLALISVLPFVQAQTSVTDGKWKDAQFTDAEKSFHLTLETLEREYVDKSLGRDDFYRAATAGMLAALNAAGHDENKLLTPQEFNELAVDAGGEITGVGVAISFDEATGEGIVNDVLVNTPALIAGIRAGDRVLSIDGRRFRGLKLIDMAQAIRGKDGETVKIKILRDDEVKTYALKRARVPVSATEYQDVDEATSYLRLGYFQSSSAKDVHEHLAKFQAQGRKKLLVDLRGNQGGLFDQAVETAEAFALKGGGEQVVAVARDRAGHSEKFAAAKGELSADVKIVVLVNEETASGAELLTAALKENQHARVIGAKTFGKWTAQSVKPLDNHFAIKYTVQKFESPQGHSYAGVGIEPDVPVALAAKDESKLASVKPLVARVAQDPQLKAALEL